MREEARRDREAEQEETKSAPTASELKAIKPQEKFDREAEEEYDAAAEQEERRALEESRRRGRRVHDPN